jgi:predicted O-linked N-acetylglucosamine transferase (SPINDLY family)
MMTQKTPPCNSTLLKEQALIATEKANYSVAIQHYDDLTKLEPDHLENYWHLGLAHLLSGDESTAQLTWMMALSSAEAGHDEEWIKSLIEVLQSEAERQFSLDALPQAWVIRRHIHEINPNLLENLLCLLKISVQLEQFKPEDLIDLGVNAMLQSSTHDFDQTLLVDTVLECEFGNPHVMDFAENCLQQIKVPAAFINQVMPKAIALWKENIVGYNMLAIYYLESCLRFDENHLDALDYLSACYFNGNRYIEAIEIARRYDSFCTTLLQKLASNGTLISRLLRTGSHWEESWSLFENQNHMLKQMVSEHNSSVNVPPSYSILCSSFFTSFYLKDDPHNQRILQNKVAEITQLGSQSHAIESVARFQNQQSSRIKSSTEKIKVAYISRCFRQHSVGWLARWLFAHHDHERFEIYTYHMHQKYIEPFAERWFVQNADRSASFSGDSLGIAEHINDHDHIDILIDLDSLTSDYTCHVMALKPAPVQATWLGLDASGLPAIDYFIADPYVLPESAQEYYSETIWRLPSTYIAVEGFEVSTPSLRRDHLGISSDAVIYLTAQQGHKRHPDNMKAQLQIIREVPNSYLLVKGLAEEKLLRETFEQTAEDIGVSPNRLRFLPRDLDEHTHRANLQIADVVLDTFPYNGATTTLETLWMGIPLVTKVGQQFAARNSYGMMMNVGIHEGIAWTDEEYINWGIRLGKDAALRQQIHWQLLQSRHTSPLWNAKQFTREMENAYKQMWNIYKDTVVG